MMFCNCKCNCTVAALVAALIIGVIGAFLQITAAITITTVFLWVAFGIAVVYLGVLAVVVALTRRQEFDRCLCAALNVLLAGILGTILFAAVILAVGIVATSVLTAVLTGILLFFLTLVFTGTACLIRGIADCAAA